MKNKLAILALAGSAAFATTSQAQGLLGIGAVDEDFESGLPFTTTLSTNFGYDSNATARSDNEEDATYVRSGLGVNWAGGDQRTNLSVGASVSALYYFDGLESVDDEVFYNARVTLGGRHAVNRRLTVGNSFYATYEIEPDHAIGASSSRRTDQYLYGYNSAFLSYAWSRRVSTIGRYTVSGVKYDDSAVGAFEDRLTHTISLEGRYLLNRLTTLVGEYRFSLTNYDSNFRDYTSHYILAGVDHMFSRNLRGTVRAGAQIRDSDFSGSNSQPYAEVALRYQAAKHTHLHWINRLGNEDSELRDHARRLTFRSSLSASQSFSERLRGNAGLTYVHNNFEQGGSISDVEEDLVALSLGMSYRLMSNIDLNAGYYFTTISSDNAFREYDRHRVSLGASITWD